MDITHICKLTYTKTDVLIRISIAVTWKGKDLFGLCILGHSPLRKAKTGTRGRGTAESLGEGYLLTGLLLCFTQHAFDAIQGRSPGQAAPPSRLNLPIHNEEKKSLETCT